MRNEIRNMDASVKARLKNIAKEYKKTFNLILQLYMQERLLYRLSVSEYIKQGDGSLFDNTLSAL